MITENKLREIFARNENDTLDFKSEPHRLDNEHFNSEFIKDILAMANTPREDAAYIVVGVKLLSDGTKQFIGVPQHPDDSDLQDKLRKARVTPSPKFTYQSVSVDGKSYGVIEIPLVRDGPFFATCDYGVVKANRLYFRRGTKNDEASIYEQNNIYRWFHEPSVQYNLDKKLDSLVIPNWDVFLQVTHKFDTDRLYLAIIGPSNEKFRQAWRLFGRLPLSLVLDFDPMTEEDGAYAHASIELKNNRSVHLLSLEDQYTLVPDKACYWYAARGLQGRANSLVNNDWKEWNRKYSNTVRKLIADFARASAGKPITVINLWYAPEYLREICSAVDQAFGDHVDYVFAVPEADRLGELAAQFGAQIISLGLGDILHGITQNISSTPTNPYYAGVPHLDGSFSLIDIPDLRWLSEDFEVLHSNIELEPSGSNRVIGRDYLRGAIISWSDLSGHYDADRDTTEHIIKQVERELETRTSVRFNIYHWPGAGGTTIARRVAWELRRRYPTVLLKRVTPGETVGRFRKIFQLTEKSILAIVEGADTIPDKLEQLYTEVRAEQIPVVFLFVLRRTELAERGERVSFVGPNLSLPESYRFVEAYKRFAPNKTHHLQNILEKSPLKERTPFHFALATFGKDFIGISRYVEARIKIASRAQNEVMTFLALAYYYGHKSVFPQIFATHLGIPENRSVQLEKFLGELQLELLVKDNDSKWRPAHQLIAEEILHINLSGNSTDKRNWKSGLSTWSLEFIDACCKGTLTTNDDLIDLLRRMFILRDEHDLLGTESSGSLRFAQLLEDIPTLEGQLSILKKLVGEFPYEAHFWGHLGRFYSIVMDEPVEALKAINKATELSPEDSVLYHMKGMCYRKMAYNFMKGVEKREDNQSDGQLRDFVEKAKEAFAMARSHDADSEHAHISPIQLLLRVLDYGFKFSGYPSRAEFLVDKKYSWYREQLDEIENLLEQAKGLREGEKPSRYIIGCEADLEQIYDNYAQALQGWDDLLTRTDVYAPPVRRQIVRAYLSRQKRNWSSIGQREIERIVDLMEDNMREEPGSDHNIRIWFRALRFSSRQDIDIALDKLANWRATGDSMESHYYLYILHVLKAMDGSMIERVRSEEFIKLSRIKARNQRNRTKSFEWFGKGQGLSQLRHFSELGEWNERTGFYENTSILQHVEGRIAKIDAPESGGIEMSSCGLLVFFVPIKSGFYKGRDENVKVRFHLGFSYDGLRAWDVRHL
ncbi:MAG: ATP-binding protein [Chloroflexi bacterium]|nr:ATP-binding protein [Chloroflexota bacterium]